MKGNAFGDFLRSRREKVQPKVLSGGPARWRRTPGLRRQEVAELAGISVDWYIRLEQGRAVSPSPETLDALTRVLCLSTVERAHLRALASSADRRTFVPERASDELWHLVQNLNQPAYVTGRRWDILAWNAAATDIFTDFSRLAEADRNILIYVLTDPDARRLFGQTWADEAWRMVAQFRGTHDFWSGEPAFHDLLQRLQEGCPEFAGWWEAHDVRRSGAGRKSLNHRERGLLHFEYATFQANDDPSLRLAIYTLAPIANSSSDRHD